MQNTSQSTKQALNNIQDCRYLLFDSNGNELILSQDKPEKTSYFKLKRGFGEPIDHALDLPSTFQALFYDSLKKVKIAVILEIVHSYPQIKLKANEKCFTIDNTKLVVKYYKTVRSLDMSDKIHQYIVAKEVISLFKKHWNTKQGKHIEVDLDYIAIVEECIPFFELKFYKYEVKEIQQEIDVKKWNDVAQVIVNIINPKINNLTGIKGIKQCCHNMLYKLILELNRKDKINPTEIDQIVSNIETDYYYVLKSLTDRFSLDSAVTGRDIPLFYSLKPQFRIKYLPILLKSFKKDEIFEETIVKKITHMDLSSTDRILTVNEDELLAQFSRTAQTFEIWKSGIFLSIVDMIKYKSCKNLDEEEFYCSVFHPGGVYKLKSNLFRLLQLFIVKSDNFNPIIGDTFQKLITTQNFIYTNSNLYQNSSFLKEESKIWKSCSVEDVGNYLAFAVDPTIRLDSMDYNYEHLQTCLKKIYNMELYSLERADTFVLDCNDKIRYNKNNRLPCDKWEEFKYTFLKIASTDINQYCKIYRIGIPLPPQTIKKSGSINIPNAEHSINNNSSGMEMDTLKPYFEENILN